MTFSEKNLTPSTLTTLGIAFNQRAGNNFDLIRLIAAYLVLFSHCFPLYGVTRNNDPFEPWGWLAGYSTFGGVAVAVFFVLSGFLITSSFDATPNPFQFLWKRVLRILPGLFGCVLFTVLFIGPLATNLTFSEYFSNSLTGEYLKNLILIPRFALPGVFADNQVNVTNAVNGSLWTLPIEFAMYLAVLILGCLRLLNKMSVIGLLGLIAVTQWKLKPLFFPDLQTVGIFLVDEFLTLSFHFFCGAFFYLVRHRISLRYEYFFACLAALVASFKTPYGHLVFTLTIPYLIFYLSFYRGGTWNFLTRRGDISYGVYLYAFPIQQLLVQIASQPKFGFWFFLIGASLLTYILATLSWIIIEKPALAFKNTFELLSFGQKRPLPFNEPPVRGASEVTQEV
jgi:peptidoglycan/LPS O-acetylase OafA/YrhL